MKPHTRFYSWQIADQNWTWCTDENGNLTNEAAQTAASLEILKQLKFLNQKLDNLGADGIHEVIRMAKTELNARKKKRRKRAKK